MNDKMDIYNAELLPLIEDMMAVAKRHAIPLLVVVQTNDNEHKLSIAYTEHDSKHMKQCKQYWLKDTMMDDKPPVGL